LLGVWQDSLGIEPEKKWYPEISARGLDVDRAATKWSKMRSEVAAMAHAFGEDDDGKEVCTQAGLALYWAQVLERGVVTAMLIARMPEHETLTRAEIDAFEATQLEKTLGRMLAAMRNYVTVPPDVDALLVEAWRKRNWLAHNFFREFNGHKQMLAWLADAQSVFQRANLELEVLTKTLRERYGLTEEAIGRLAAELMAEAPTE
jgi:hypothetical protein